MKLSRYLSYVATFAVGAIAVAAVTVFDSPNPDAQAAQNSVRSEAVAVEPSKKKLELVRSLTDSSAKETVTNISQLERNTRVVIEGVVMRTREEDEFVLEDATGSVQVFTGTTFFPVEVGEQVRVRGFVDESLLLEVYAQEIIHRDGSVTKIDY